MWVFLGGMLTGIVLMLVIACVTVVVLIGMAESVLDE